MTVQFRNALSNRILQVLRVDSNESLAFQSIYGALTLRRGNNQPEFHLSTKQLAAISKIVGVTKSATEVVSDVLNANYDKEKIVEAKLSSSSSSSDDSVVTFAVNRDNFVNELFVSADTNAFNETKKQIIVEFSSPNIAKPFHFGHLRSTIIGNFISNLFKSFGHNVIRMNYLGDWGTQFGLLKIGMELSKLSSDDIKANPITHLFNAYVKANQMAASDPSISEKARHIFCQLENGQLSDLSDWTKYREFTVEELEGLYKRLGIVFDEYSWESEYRKPNISKIIDLMNNNRLLKIESDGKAVIEFNGKSYPMLKSDGTTLYLTRDVAAIFDRSEKYNFDEMFYVVENGQHDHFSSLVGITKLLRFPKADHLRHIKFGRIANMSTRKGNVVFLRDVLDEARDLALESMQQDKDTKIDLASMGHSVADILGTSSVIINDLRLKRNATYEFDLEKASKVTGDTGYNLQYTHCRLCRLEEIPGVKAASHCNPSLLLEPEALNLIYCMARCPDVLKAAKDSLEACRIVKYTFELCKAINKAHRALSIKNESNASIQEQRMLLFATARSIVNKNMRILGLQPLEKM